MKPLAAAPLVLGAFAGLALAQGPARPSAAPRPVEPPAALPIRPMVVPNCRVRLRTEVQVPAKTDGTIGKVLVEEGDLVAKDQPLAQLDDRLAALDAGIKEIIAKNDAPLQQAKKKKEFAEVQHRASKELFLKRGGVSRDEYEQKVIAVNLAETEIYHEEQNQQRAKEDLKKAEAILDYHVIRAPFAGRVQQRIKQPGEAVQKLEAVFHLVQTDVVRVEGEVEQATAARLKPGLQVEVWPDPTTGPLQRYSHSGPVNSVRVLPDGARFAYAAEDGSVTVWSRRTDSRERVLNVCAKPLQCLATSKARPNELLSGGEDGTLYVLALGSGDVRPLRDSRTGDAGIVTVVRDPVDPDRCWTGHRDGRIHAWNLASGEVARTLPGHVNQVTALAVAERRPILLSADDQEIRVWDRETGEALQQFRGRSSPPKHEVRQLSFSPTGDEFPFNSDGLLQVRRLPDGMPVAEFEHPAGNFSHLAVFAPTPGLALTAGPDGALQLWQRPTPAAAGKPARPARLARIYSRHSQSETITQVDFTPDGRFFLSAGADRSVRLWAVPTLEELEAERLPGRVTFVSPIADRTSDRTLSFHVEAANPAGRLVGNTTASVVVVTGP